MSTTPQAAIVNLALNSVISRVLYAVTALGVPDMLTDGRQPVADLARKAQTDETDLARLLRLLVEAGFLDVEDGRFGLTAEGAVLRAGHESAAREMVLTMLGPLYTLPLLQLPRTVTEGVIGAQAAFGAHFFDHLASNPNEAADFNRLMLAFHGDEPEAVATAWPVPEARHIVDVGGGVGTLLRTVLSHLPDARGTLYDLEDVVYQADLGDEAGRIELRGGDFFEHVPEGGDVYVLSHILHDWDDARAGLILRRCREALPPGGRLLVVEMMLPSDGSAHPANLLDIIMLSLVGGRERTLDDYRHLLTSAGFRLERTVRTASPVSIFEAVASD